MAKKKKDVRSQLRADLFGTGAPHLFLSHLTSLLYYNTSQQQKRLPAWGDMMISLHAIDIRIAADGIVAWFDEYPDEVELLPGYLEQIQAWRHLPIYLQAKALYMQEAQVDNAQLGQLGLQWYALCDELGDKACQWLLPRAAELDAYLEAEAQARSLDIKQLPCDAILRLAAQQGPDFFYGKSEQFHEPRYLELILQLLQNQTCRDNPHLLHALQSISFALAVQAMRGEAPAVEQAMAILRQYESGFSKAQQKWGQASIQLWTAPDMEKIMLSWAGF